MASLMLVREYVTVPDGTMPAPARMNVRLYRALSASALANQVGAGDVLLPVVAPELEAVRALARQRRPVLVQGRRDMWKTSRPDPIIVLVSLNQESCVVYGRGGRV
jgi:hypothetical protein